MPSPLHEDFSDVTEIAPDVEGLEAARARSRARFDAQLAAAHPVTASRQGGGRGRAIIAAAAVAALLVAGGTTLLLTRDGNDTVKVENADSSPTQSVSTPGPSDPSQEPSVSGTTGTSSTAEPSASATGSATPTANGTGSPSAPAVNISMPKPLGPATAAEWTTIGAPRSGTFSVTLAPGVPQTLRVAGAGKVPAGAKAISVSIEYSKTSSASKVWAYAGGTKRPQHPTMELESLSPGESAYAGSGQYMELGADGTVVLESDSAITITGHVARFQRNGNSNVFSFQSSGSSFDVASQLGTACLFSKDSVLCTLPEGVKLPPRPAKCDASTWGAFGILSTGRDPQLQCDAGDPGFGEGMPIRSQRATIYGPGGLRCEVEGERLTCTAGGGRSMQISPKGFQLVGKNGVVQSN